MSPLVSYAVKSLCKNRTRTIVTVIGVMMSTALLAALAVFGSSLYRYAKEGYINEEGDWHVGIANGSRQDVEAICAEDDVENPFLAKSIGYVDVRTGGRPYLYLLGVGQEYCERMPIHVTEGRLPEREGEILLPESSRGSLLAKGFDDPQSGEQQPGGLDRSMIGSTVTLEVGLRQRNGITLWQSVPYGYYTDGGDSLLTDSDQEEQLLQLQSQDYVVVGYYEESLNGNSFYDLPGCEALVWWNGEMTEDGFDRYSLWFQIADVGNNAFHRIYDRLRLFYGYNGRRLPVNLNLLSLYGVQIGQKGESAATAAVVVILLFIILTGSVMLIYNAFAISVGERTRQFGLLSSIGATKKQIRRSVICEAVMVSGAGILLGVLTGIGLVAAAFWAMGEMVAELMEFSMRPQLHIWIPAVLLAAGLALLAVLVSAWIPARRATKVTAMEAIRQNREIQYTGKQKRVPGFVEGLFGYEGVLAVIYSRRNRKRYRVITAALLLSMVLFVSINAFSDYMMTVIRTEYKTTNYDILIQFLFLLSPGGDKAVAESERREILETLRGMEGVDSVTRTAYLACRMPAEANDGHLTEDFQKVLESYHGTGRPSMSISVIDDESFLAFCREHELEEARFLDMENLTVIVKNHFMTVDSRSGNAKLIEGLLSEDGRFYVDLAQDYYREDHQEKMVEFTAGYYAESLAPGCNDNWNLTIMLPERVAKALGLQETANDSLTFCVTTSEHRRVASEAERLFRDRYPECTIFDQAKRQAGNRNLVFLLRVLANGFIVMITMVSMANVFSTISSSLKLRRKEFAMLKTVGMTGQGLRRMMNLECLMYGGKAVIFGLPVSVLTTAVMYHYFQQDVIFDFYLPVQSILVAIGSIFGVVFATMLYTMGRMKKENVIDVLKQENF